MYGTFEVAPKLDKLKLLFSQNAYNFDEASDIDISDEIKKTNTSLHNWDDLVDKVQASVAMRKLSMDY